MTALTLELPEETLQRLDVVAHARGNSVTRLFEEMSNVMLGEADAQTRFQLRARCGAGKDARGLALLEKAASRAPSHNSPADV